MGSLEILESKEINNHGANNPHCYDLTCEARGAKEINKYEAKYVLFRMFSNQIAYWVYIKHHVSAAMT